MNKHAIDIISKYLKKMVRSGNAVSSHSGLIPSENLYEKRGGMLWPITTKKNLIRLRSAAFFSIFVCNLVHTYKFHGYLKPLDCVFFFFFFLKLTISVCLLQVSRTLKTRKAINWGFKCHKFSPDFVFTSERPNNPWHCFHVLYL